MSARACTGCESRLRALEARPGYAGVRGRIAMRGRHAADLAHELRRALRAHVATRERAYQALRLTLETFDLRRRLGRIRARLVAADGRLAGAGAQRSHGADRRLARRGRAPRGAQPAGRARRGYAVCWNADRTAVIRDANAVSPGERVRVTLARGELDCDVTATET